MDNQSSAEHGAPGRRVSPDRRTVPAYLAALRWWETTCLAEPRAEQDSSRSAEFPPTGFLLHSLLGPALRRGCCPASPRCSGPCQYPDRCGYARLLEPSVPPAVPTRFGLARLPPPLIVDAGWEGVWAGAPLPFAIKLLGDAGEWRGSVEQALRDAFLRGVGPTRASYDLRCDEWRQHSLDLGSASGAAAPNRTCRLTLSSPLRIVRRHEPLRSFSLPDLVRDLNFRIAVWGCAYQGLPWAAAWTFLQDDAKAARVRVAQAEWVDFRRYSGRQARSLQLGGLLGSIEIEGASEELRLLLEAGCVCGAGKGASIGLGRMVLL